MLHNIQCSTAEASYIFRYHQLPIYNYSHYLPLSLLDSLSLQDQATGGDVYSVVNKKHPPVLPYAVDDPNHSQLKQASIDLDVIAHAFLATQCQKSGGETSNMHINNI